MESKHVHRPSFWDFLWREKHRRIQGRRVSLYRCRECGAEIRIAASQQAFHDFLPGLGIILGLFLSLTLLYLNVQARDGIRLAALIGLILLLWLAVYGIAYRFTRFVKAPIPEGEKAGEGKDAG